MKSRLSTHIVKSRGEFRNLRQDWNSLLNISPVNTIFLRWEWLYNWWRVYGTDAGDLFIITVRDDTKLLGIAPLYIRPRFGGVFREVKFLGSNIICSDYLDFIVHKNKEPDVLRVIFSFLKSSKNWHSLNLTDIPEDSKLYANLKDYFAPENVEVNVKHSVCPYVPLDREWQDIIGSFNPRLRNIIRRKRKRFEALPHSAYVEARPDNISDSYEELARLSRLRMKMLNRTSPFEDSRFIEFHRRVLYELYPSGMAKLCFLKADNQFLAAIYLLIYNSKYYFYQSGFDPEWAWLSPGTLLFYYSIKKAHCAKITEFDFLRGNENYKGYWTKEKRRGLSIKIINKTTAGSVLGGLEAYMNLTKHIVKKSIQIVKKKCAS